jgi:hypothetical protein
LALFVYKKSNVKENNQMNERKMKTIFSQRLAGLLMTKGFVLVGMEQGKNNTGKNVFYFNDSDELRSAMEEYKASSLKG